MLEVEKQKVFIKHVLVDILPLEYPDPKHRLNKVVWVPVVFSSIQTWI